MLRARKDLSHPQYFACPFGLRNVQEFKLTEVREKFGDDFNAQFWPLFGAFNCLLPAHAPEAEEAEPIKQFVPPPP